VNVRRTICAATGILLALRPGPAPADDLTRVIETISGGPVDCVSPGGDEITVTRQIRAPDGYFFARMFLYTEPQTHIYEYYSLYHQEAACSILDSAIVFVPATLSPQFAPVNAVIPVATSYTVLAHAQCGAGERKAALSRIQHHSITIVCRFEGALAPIPQEK
jgi:hypothetical protein